MKMSTERFVEINLQSILSMSHNSNMRERSPLSTVPLTGTSVNSRHFSIRAILKRQLISKIHVHSKTSKMERKLACLLSFMVFICCFANESLKRKENFVGLVGLAP